MPRGLRARHVVIALALLVGALPAFVAGLDVLRAPGEALRALVDPTLWARVLTSVVLTLAALALAAPLACALGWLCARTDLPGARGLVPLSLLPLFLPPLVHALTWAGELGLRGPSGIVVVHAVAALPLIVVCVTRSLETLDRARFECARLVGGLPFVLREELRQVLPGAVGGSALAAALILGDFAVADFLTSVGPKVTVAADSVYAHHVASRPAAAAAAALPTALLAVLGLALALRFARQVGGTVGGRFHRAPRIALGRARLALGVAASAVVGAVALAPFVLLAWRAGSITLVLGSARDLAPAIGFTLVTSAAAASLMTTLALGLVLDTDVTGRTPRRGWLGALLFLPLLVPALTYGIGIVRIWNRPWLDAVYLGPAIVVLAAAGRYLVLTLLPLQDTRDRIDRRLLETAALAGAGAGARAWHVLLPLLTRAALVAWCVGFGFAMREMDALLMLRAGQRTLGFKLYSSVVFARDAQLAAMALIQALTSALPFCLFFAATTMRKADR
jgi:iron(III) transport system permease protein